MTSIDARPAEAGDRAGPESREGDLMIGKGSAMATLVERASRYTVPVALPAGRRDAVTTCDALIAAVSGMPSQLVKTLTWDQGSEMADHAAFTLATAVDVYFAHPHSPWERGTNETPTGCCGGRTVCTGELRGSMMESPPDSAARVAAERRATADRVAALAGQVAALAEQQALTTHDDEHDPEGVTIGFERAQLLVCWQAHVAISAPSTERRTGSPPVPTVSAYGAAS